MSSIVLATLNARYHHASFGLRYLKANLGELAHQTLIKEYTIKSDPIKIAEELIDLKPKVLGFGVYIWNAEQTLKVIKKIKSLSPHTLIVVGGPEVSFETEKQDFIYYVDYIFKGEADFTFRDFCQRYIRNGILPQGKIISSEVPEITQIQMPYDLYTDEDIKNRIIYVEASRGCPYKCEYCLSSLDKSVRNFNIDIFLQSMQKLIERGVRQFKFVDRTFNLSPTISIKILQFFLDRIELKLFLHFEMVPDRLPDELKSLIQKFPEGSLQFEIGIQTWNTEVSKNVSRKQNYEKINENFEFLNNHTKVHTHADLIVGLPGETLQSFAEGFDQLFSLKPHEIQVGILKRLKGTPIIRHENSFEMVYCTKSPFQILKTKDMSFLEIESMDRFASFWDKIANSGKWGNFFTAFTNFNSEKSMFWSFYDLSIFLWNKFERTHSISMEELSFALYTHLISNMNLSLDNARDIILADLKKVGFMYFPDFLNYYVSKANINKKYNLVSTPKRQNLHLK